MGNMGYCRFRNTLADLNDCYDSLDEHGLSKEEEKARNKLVRLCQHIAENYSDDYLEEGDDLW